MLLPRLNRALRWRLGVLQAHLVFWWWASLGSQPRDFQTGSAVVFAPHQDDETLGCGGLIALKRSAQVPVWVVFLTDGAASDSLGSTYDPNLVQTRVREATTALATLGVDSAHTHFLNLPDGGLSHLTPHQRQTLINRLGEILRQTQAQEVYVTHPRDAHPDHESTSALVRAALDQTQSSSELWYYPIWMIWHRRLGRDLAWRDLQGARRLDISQVRTQKLQAIAAYTSQFVILPRRFVAQHASQWEIYLPGPKPP